MIFNEWVNIKLMSLKQAQLATISFGLNIFKIYLVRIRLVEIQSEYCICSVLICELEIHNTLFWKGVDFHMEVELIHIFDFFQIIALITKDLP